MSTINTLLTIANDARKGASWRDKWLSFLVTGLIVMGKHRINLRKWWLKKIDNLSIHNTLEIKLKIEGKVKYFSMRRGNEADYIIGGELLKGSYKVPDFEPKIIIDGGANIGMFAIHSNSYFPQAKLICYEPDKDNVQQLQKNLDLNNIEAEIRKLGLWSKETILYYHVSESHIGFIDENPPGTPIPCTLPEIKSDCWLKLDIEGAEYEVLPALFQKGQYPRWISMEIHYFNTKGESLLTLLREHGYEIEGDVDFAVNCTVISAYRN